MWSKIKKMQRYKIWKRKKRNGDAIAARSSVI